MNNKNSTVRKMKDAVKLVTESEYTSGAFSGFASLPAKILELKVPNGEKKFNRAIELMSQFVASEIKDGLLDSAEAVKNLPSLILKQQDGKVLTPYNAGIQAVSKFVKDFPGDASGETTVDEAFDLGNTFNKLRFYILNQINEILADAKIGTLYKDNAPYGIDLSTLNMNSDGTLSLTGQAGTKKINFKLQLVKDTSGY